MVELVSMGAGDGGRSAGEFVVPALTIEKLYEKDDKCVPLAGGWNNHMREVQGGIMWANGLGRRWVYFSNSLAAKGEATYMNLFFSHRSEIKGNATPEKGERIEGEKEGFTVSPVRP